FFFFILVICQNLSGKMFTFPQETNTARCTVSLFFLLLFVFLFLISDWSFTDLSRTHSLFSLATQWPDSDNGFVMGKATAADTVGLYVANQGLISVLDYELNTWHSICSTWGSESGLAQLWFNGKPLVRKFISESQIDKPLVALGQEQDSYGGKFDIKQSFVGMMTDVHMWNYVLSSCEIQNYVGNLNFTPGNVLNWKALTFEKTGNVLIENKQLTCH
uniref:Pentraxin family member n=1 Tax=Poecilia reticulata TaxID=8081 RepID=A0A3P9Q548_POERE